MYCIECGKTCRTITETDSVTHKSIQISKCCEAEVIKYAIDDTVYHQLFGKGIIAHLNMSGPVVQFEKYKDEMCCPEYTLRRMF